MSEQEMAKEIDEHPISVGQALITLAKNVPSMKAVVVMVIGIFTTIGGGAIAISNQIAKIEAYPARLSTAQMDIQSIKDQAVGLKKDVQDQRAALEHHLDTDALRWVQINAQTKDIQIQNQRLDEKIDRVLTILAEKR